jgi:acyl carrier protein
MGGRSTVAAASESEIKETVKEYILREFLPGDDAGELDDSVLLVTNGILDSVSTVKMVAFLEERYGVAFEAYEMGADNLDSLPLIAQTVRSKLES